MKILNAEQIRKVDALSILRESITSLELMERSARCCFKWIKKNFSKKNTILVLCGPGNNGGDGLVIARLLQEEKYSVIVWLIHISEHGSEDFQTNRKKLPSDVPVRNINTIADLENFRNDLSSIIIDAIFGSGLNRPVDGLAAEVIQRINSQSSTVIAIDIPSGLFADQLPLPDDRIIHANYTLSFQVPKFTFFFPSTASFLGQWKILDIGLDAAAIKEQTTDFTMLDIVTASQLLKPRNKFDYKSKFGHALLCSGSRGKIGASILAAKACLRSGVGLLTVQSPACGVDNVQSTVPEAMVLADPCRDSLSQDFSDLTFDAIAVGPGCGTTTEMKIFLASLLKHEDKPMVLDADALNILAENPEMLADVPRYSLLTPHIGEFKRLVGDFSSDAEGQEKLMSFSKKHEVILILKGAHTRIAHPDGRLCFNSSGNPGMARGGSGDALCGILLAFLAQGYVPFEAAQLGVFLHGLAGDLAAKKKTVYAMTIADLIEKLPAAFEKVLESEVD